MLKTLYVIARPILFDASFQSNYLYIHVANFPHPNKLKEELTVADVALRAAVIAIGILWHTVTVLTIDFPPIDFVPILPNMNTTKIDWRIDEFHTYTLGNGKSFIRISNWPLNDSHIARAHSFTHTYIHVCILGSMKMSVISLPHYHIQILDYHFSFVCMQLAAKGEIVPNWCECVIWMLVCNAVCQIKMSHAVLLWYDVSIAHTHTHTQLGQWQCVHLNDWLWVSVTVTGTMTISMTMIMMGSN